MSKPPEVRAATDDDASAVRRVVTAAYGGERMARLLDALREDPVAWLDLAFVAEDKDGVVAACAYTRGWLDSPTRLVRCWCSPRSRCGPTGSATGSARC